MSDIHPASAAAGAEHAQGGGYTYQSASSFFLPSWAGLGDEREEEAEDKSSSSSSSSSSCGRGGDGGTERALTKRKRSYEEKEGGEKKEEHATAGQLRPRPATAPATEMTTSHTLSKYPDRASSTSSKRSPTPSSGSPHCKKKKLDHDHDDQHHEVQQQLQQQQEQDEEQRVWEEGQEVKRDVKEGFLAVQGEEGARKKRQRQRHVYPAHFSSAPFLTPALQDRLIGLFRDDAHLPRHQSPLLLVLPLLLGPLLPSPSSIPSSLPPSLHTTGVWKVVDDVSGPGSLLKGEAGRDGRWPVENGPEGSNDRVGGFRVEADARGVW